MYPGHRIMKVVNRTSAAVKKQNPQKETRGDDSVVFSAANASDVAPSLPGKSA
jgi:hypothetical protein